MLLLVDPCADIPKGKHNLLANLWLIEREFPIVHNNNNNNNAMMSLLIPLQGRDMYPPPLGG